MLTRGDRDPGLRASPEVENKTAVMVPIQRDGPMRTKVVGRGTKDNVRRTLNEIVDRESTLLIDEDAAYKQVGRRHRMHASATTARANTPVGSFTSIPG